eukprot:1151864-Amphidinium_carterae.1
MAMEPWKCSVDNDVTIGQIWLKCAVKKSCLRSTWGKHTKNHLVQSDNTVAQHCIRRFSNCVNPTVGNTASAAGMQQAQIFPMTPTAVTPSQTPQASPRDLINFDKDLQTVVHQWRGRFLLRR